VEGGGCEGISNPIKTVPKYGPTGLTSADPVKSGEAAFIVYQTFQSAYGGDIMDFLAYVMARETTGANPQYVSAHGPQAQSLGGFDMYISHAVAHQIFFKPHGQYGGELSEVSIFNSLGSYCQSLHQLVGDSTLDWSGIPQYAVDRGKFIADRILNSPAQWRRPDYQTTVFNNYWNGQYAPANLEPSHWGNQQMYTSSVQLLLDQNYQSYWMAPGDDPFFIVTEYQNTSILAPYRK